VKTLIFVLIGSSIFRYHFQGAWSFWWPQWALLCAGLVICLGIDLSKRIHWSVGPAFISTGLSSLYISVWHDNIYLNNPILVRNTLASFGLYTLVSFVLIWLVVSRIKDVKKIEQAFAFICVVNSVFVLGEFMLNLPTSGFLGNGSINGSFIAFSVPLVLKYTEDWRISQRISISSACILAVMLSNSSMAVGTLAVSLGIYAYFKVNKCAFCVIFIIIMIFGYIALGPNLLNDSNRFEYWAMFWDWWTRNANIWFGTGNGSFLLLGRVAQDLSGDLRHGLLMAHNDPFQLLFEQGILGILWYTVMAFCAIKRALYFKRFHIVACLFGWFGASLGIYPGHYAITAFMGVFLVFSCFQKRR